MPLTTTESGSRIIADSRPRCPVCAEKMVFPESSGLTANGTVSHLWSCDSCGQTLVTYWASQRLAANPLSGRYG